MAGLTKEQRQQISELMDRTLRTGGNPIRAAVAAISRIKGAPTDVMMALANQESGFNPKAISSVGAIGVMQLMPDTARGLGVNPYDVLDNIVGGVEYFMQQYKKYKGDRKKALAAYNAGPGAVDKYNGVPPYKETQNYVQSIEAQMKNFKDYVEEASKDAQVAGTQEQKRLASNYEKVLEDARKAYDWQGVNQVTDAYIKQYNSVIKQLRDAYPTASLEDIRKEGDRYMQQITNIQDFSRQSIEDLKAMNTKENLIDPAVQGYDQRSLELQRQLQEANPYTRMAQMAPMEYIDPKLQRSRMNTKAVMDAYGRSIGLEPAYDWGQHYQNVAAVDRATRLANATGLTPEEFLQGGTIDYNALSGLGQGRVANYGNLNNAYIQNVVPNLNRDITSMTNAANTQSLQAMEQARLAEQTLLNQQNERMKQEVELAKQGLGNVNTLYNTGLTGYNQQGLANTQVVPSIYGTSEGNLTSRLNTIENNQRAMQEAYLRSQQGGASGQNINPVTAANSLVNAGVYSNNAGLINLGAGTTLGALNYTPEQIQSILQQGNGIVNQNPYGIIPGMMIPMNNNN